MTLLYQIGSTHPGGWRAAVCESPEQLCNALARRMANGVHKVYTADPEARKWPNGAPFAVTPHTVTVG